MRRIIKDKGLYYVNNVVDINNIISLRTLWSIGAYDIDKIVGDYQYDVGLKEDVYEGIGRGILNIENLPVLRDELGAFGSATSDSLRTMVTTETKKLLMVIHAFGAEDVSNSLDELERLLTLYASADNIEKTII
jgi:DNA/RNA-binding domain of Phe-tRNA-synthetase-like protein